MSGYTPLFDSLTRGTLCGRWPDIGLWPIILSLADKNGEVDVTPLYIAGITGLPEPEVIACMDRFCEPDPYSRSQDQDGRRLVLMDDHRNWGWRIVNHSRYREKARKQAYDSRRTQSGEDAERKRKERGSVPTSPDESRDIPPSNANANSNPNPQKHTGAPRPCEPPEFAEFKSIFPRRAGSQPWSDALKAINARLHEGHTWDEILAGARRYALYVRSTEIERTQHVLQAKTFCGTSKRFLEPFDLPVTKAERRTESNLGAFDEAEERLFGGQRH